MTKSILVLTPFYSPNIGGVETHLDDLTAFFKKKKLRQVVITYQPLTSKNAQAPFAQRDGKLTIYRLPWFKNNLFYRLESKPLLQFPYLSTGLFFFSLFYLLFNSSKFEIIHAHGLASMVVGWLLAKIFRKKLVVSLHTIYKFNQRPALAWTVKFFFNATDAILVLAQGVKDDLVGIGVNSEKIQVYTNWLDLDKRFILRDKEKSRRKVGLPQKNFLALFVGRLSPEKGVRLLLDTIPHAPKGVTFVIVGGGPMREEVEAVAKKHKNIIYVGPVSSEILPYYYSSSDVLFWGSVDQDYFGRVTMGALASGLPVLIPSETEYFGKMRPVEIDFPQGKIGYMLKPKPELVSRKLIEIAKPGVLAKMRLASRRYAEKHFGLDNAKVFLEAYGH